jgi:putative membrane protein
MAAHAVDKGVVTMMDWYDHGGLGWGGWLLMAMMMLIVWSAIVVGAIALWRYGRRDSNMQPAEPRPLALPDARQLLDERFARGELDPDDYTRRRDLLASGK